MTTTNDPAHRRAWASAAKKLLAHAHAQAFSSPTVPTNAARAARARLCVELYALATGHTTTDDGFSDLDTHLSDLLADLLHLADAQNFDFEDQLARAQNHHHAERNEGTSSSHVLGVTVIRATEVRVGDSLVEPDGAYMTVASIHQVPRHRLRFDFQPQGAIVNVANTTVARSAHVRILDRSIPQGT